ncbi:MAG: hypothetical protein H5U08_00710 [Thermogutta sp.]|uniref:hypothetical protein n=1 Tax=Thermogutta sp. TaxID=1962930 RepID=UPI0019C9F6F7|nr:hypothetical protein [Thermogutta sp.]MBC7350856.1 hypothetical protein [Thermogutta sp.]
MANTLFGYVEVSGSNTVSYDATSIARIDRVFVGPAATWHLFVRYIANRPHPVARWAYPIALQISPLLGEATKSITPRDPGRSVIGYDAARIQVTYGVNGQAIAIWPQGIDLPPRRPGTWLELKLESGGEFMFVEGAAKWADNPNGYPDEPVPGPTSAAARYYVPQQKITVVWHNVLILRAKELDKMVGKVNSHPFLGKPPETLLFESYNLAMENTLDLDFPVRWAVTCNFIYRGIVVGGHVYGWNHELRHDGWKEVIVETGSGPGKRYEPTSFKWMFM